MGGSIRELLRAAQEAEVRGDAASAIARLREAAQVYEAAGKRTRALAMLRHAQRLDPSRVEVSDAIGELEAAGAENTAAPAGEEALPGARDRVLVDRGPTLADGTAQAWCSFCCRPNAEIGALVAGPAGAFVCRACTLEARRLFEGRVTDVVEVALPSHPTDAANASVLRELRAQAVEEAGSFVHARSEPAPAEDVVATESVGEASVIEAAPELAPARDAVLRALAAGGRRILLVGPAGAGKTAVLEEVGRPRRGFFFSAATAPRSLPGDWLLILDAPELPDASAWAPARALLDHHEGAAIIAVRGTAVAPSVRLRRPGAECAVPSTQALVSATDGALPLEIAEQIDTVIAVAPLEVPALTAVAARLMKDRGFEPPVIQRMAAVVAKVAFGSGRGIHEVRALVRRIPAGPWTAATTTGTGGTGRTGRIGRAAARKKKR